MGVSLSQRGDAPFQPFRALFPDVCCFAVFLVLVTRRAFGGAVGPGAFSFSAAARVAGL